MGDWINPNRYQMHSHDPSLPPCGTAACIGGFANILTKSKLKSWRPSDWKRSATYVSSQLNATDIYIRAMDLLELSEDEGDRLFSLDNWPCKFLDRYKTANTPWAAGMVVISRIKHFIKTKGEE